MIEGFEPAVVDTLGGLCTLMERSDLPVGLSPLAKNVKFFPGGVQSRGGFSSFWTEAGVSDGYWSLTDFVDGRGDRYYAFLRGGKGTLAVLGYPGGVATQTDLTQRMGFNPSFSTIRTATLYGRVYVCLSDGIRGLMPPWQIASTSGLVARNVAATGGHEALIAFGAGAMLAGTYYVAVAFETDTGYISGAVKLNYDTTAVPCNISLSSIPIGPPGTTKRRIFISLVDSFELYNPAGLVINDNTTTSFGPFDLTVDEIASGLPFIDYIGLRKPPMQLGVEAYSNRLVYWGGDGRIDSFFGPTNSATPLTYSSIGLINLDFSADVASSYTWGVAGEYGEWYGASASAAVTAGSYLQGELSNYLTLTSSGGATDALVQQGYGSMAVTARYNRDTLGNYYLQPGRKYGIRVRARRSATGAAGNLVIKMYEHTALGARTTLTTATFPVTSMGEEWNVFEAYGTTAPTGLANLSIDVYLANVTNAAKVDVSHIEVFDNEYRRGTSTLSISRVDDPESFDVVSGSLTVSPNDGQEIRDVFVLNGNMYIAKERSLYVVTDNGQEPAFWSPQIVSDTVGTPSVHGSAVGDNFALLASRDGLYLLTGGSPLKVSQEIQPTWDLFDWTKGERIFVAIDTVSQYAIVGGPTSTGYQQLRVDFVQGWGDPVGSGGNGRKWSTDTRFTGTPATETGKFNGAATVTRRTGERSIVYCASDDSTGAYYESASVHSDYSGKIESVYETAPLGMDMGRSLFGTLLHKLRGSGTLLSWFVRPDGSATVLPSKTLGANPLHDVEIHTNNTDTQLGIRIGTSATGDYFIAKRLCVFRKRAPFSLLRGY